MKLDKLIVYPCTNCHVVSERARTQCKHCLDIPINKCHTKECTNMVTGDIGTKCDSCKVK